MTGQEASGKRKYTKRNLNEYCWQGEPSMKEGGTGKELIVQDYSEVFVIHCRQIESKKLL